MSEFEEEETIYAVRPNKTQIKKDIAKLHQLAEELIRLSNSQLQEMALAEDLFKAVNLVAAMPLKGARKRQLKFITGMLRKIEIDPILENLARLKSSSAHATREHHLLERWRDRFLLEGDEALRQFLNEYPVADSQQLRQLIRNAKKELAADKPAKSSRQIYRYLRDFLAENQSSEIQN